MKENSKFSEEDTQARSGAKRVLLIYLSVMVVYSVWKTSWLFPLVWSNQHTTGIQREVYPHFGCTCKYTFFVEDKEFSGTGKACCSVPAGHLIDVYFNPENPEKSHNFEPKRQLINDLMYELSPIIVLPLIALSVMLIAHSVGLLFRIARESFYQSLYPRRQTKILIGDADDEGLSVV